MKNFEFQLKNAAIIAACFAVCVMFSRCIDFDDQLRIVITNIPAEYNGKNGQTSLWTKTETYVASGATHITNGKASIDLSRSAQGDWIIYNNEKYSVVFKISEEFDRIYPWDKEWTPEKEEEGYTVWYWEGEGLINIKLPTTTVSFTTLQKWDGNYPYTDYGSPPLQITIKDIPAELSETKGPPSDFPLPSHCYYRYGFVYLLKPDDRELYAYSFPYDYSTKDRETWTYMDREFERGKYIVVFKIKETSCNSPAGRDIICWEGESEPIDIIRKNTTISFNTLKKWDRSYPYTTNENEGWKDRD